MKRVIAMPLGVLIRLMIKSGRIVDLQKKKEGRDK